MDNQSELAFEQQRLEQTIALAKEQRDRAERENEDNKEAILAAKQELRENTSHSIGSLWSSDAFEALAELSQYANPVTDKIADYESVQNKIAQLEKVIKEPYFARIDFRFDGEGDYEKIYIGRSSLKKNKYEMQIYDWRSPIASVFYRFVTGAAFYDAPGGRITGTVNLKRQYEISNSVLEFFFDADVQIVDEFLRKLLSQNTTSQMKTIIETIQKEQDIVIRDMDNDLLMVQGVAGSGKTSIALHRAAYLMYQGLSAKLSAHNIMIVSPNALFEQYIANVLPELGEENVVSVVFEEMLSTILQTKQIESRNHFLENLITSLPRQHKLIKSSIEFKLSEQFRQIIDRFLSDIPSHFIAYEDVYYEGKLIAKKELLQERMKGRVETPLGMKLTQLEDYVLELIGQMKQERIRRSAAVTVREEMQRFTVLDVPGVYKKLFQDPAYFYQLAQGLELPENIAEILTYTKENLDSEVLCYDDATVLAYLTARINGVNKYKNIKQVVIDEAQDYYPLQYELFRFLFKTAKFTVLGDMNQTLEKQEDLSFYEQVAKILDKKKASLVTMDKSFRCTSEILNFSLKFIDQHPGIKSFNRQGEEPQVHSAADEEQLDEMLIAEVKACQQKGYQSIGLICKTQKNARILFERLRGKMDIQLIKGKSVSDLEDVFIIPVSMSKGLEFDAVLICDVDAGNYQSKEDKKLLYIACTRALHRLNLFCESKISPLLP